MLGLQASIALSALVVFLDNLPRGPLGGVGNDS